MQVKIILYIVNDANETGLYIGCKTGNFTLVEELLKYSPNLEIGAIYRESCINYTETPLECAARWGYIRIIVLFINYKELKSKALKSMIKKALKVKF